MSILIIISFAIFLFTCIIYFLSIKCNISNINKVSQKIIPNTIQNRDDIGILLENEKFESIIEVGVQSGGYANALLSRWNSCKTYVMVDPWLQQKFYDDSANVPNIVQNQIFNNAMNVVTKYSSRVEFVILKMTSDKAIPYLKGKLFDFIYLDGRHDYLSVKNDINWYYPLVKAGGIIGGHDYQDSPKAPIDKWLLDSNGNKNSEYKAVKSAVDEFASENKLNITIAEVSYKSWMIRKPN